MKNKIVIAVFIFVFCLMGLSYKVKANDVLVNEEIEVIGAQVRTTGKTGIRFVGSVGEYDTSNVKNYGILLAYGKTEEEIYIDSVINGQKVYKTEVTELNDQGYFYVTLYNIPISQYGSNISARAYVVDDNDNVIYGKSHISRSLDAVVFQAYVNGNRTDFVSEVFDNIVKLTAEELVYNGNAVTDYNGDREVIAFPENVEILDYGAFSRCTTFKYVYIPKNIKTIFDDAFSNCTSLEVVYISEGLNYIGNHTFSNCRRLKSITLPDSLENIGSYVFKDCISLTSMRIPFNVESIGKGALEGCDNLVSVVLPFVGSDPYDNNDYFGYIFGADSYSDQNQSIPTSLKDVLIYCEEDISDYAFYKCSNIETINLDNCDTIGNNAFQNCTSLVSVKITNAVYILGKYAFADCTSLKSIKIPPKVGEVEEGTFQNCTSLENVIIINVYSIGVNAFSGCYNIKNVYYVSDEEGWNEISIKANNDNLINANRIYNYTI